MNATCKVWRSHLVRCTRVGVPNPDGSFLVCPDALAEHEPAALAKPYQARRHRDVGIRAAPPRYRERYPRNQAERAELFLFGDPRAGMRQ
jgi:hypothetical protein